jgi:RimJ/RimL family protein N-acetyltransferase
MEGWMLQKLALADHAMAAPVLEGVEHALLVQAVIEGSAPGWIAVDRREAPRSVFASAAGAHYVLGDASNPAFNAALAELIHGQILPHARQAGWAVFNLHYYPNHWEAVLDELLGDAPVVKNYQRFFRLQQPAVAWRERVPPGFRLCRVDGDLLGEASLDDVERLRGFVEGTYASLEAFLELGLGMCALHNQQIVSWCTTDCVVGQRCEVGIRTREPYRRQGLGTLVAAAMVDACLSRGLTEIGWHCWSQNLASAATAEKVGFREVLQHHAVHLWLNPVDGLLVKANLALMRGEARAAAELYEQAFARRETVEAGRPGLMGQRTPEATYFYHAACAWALAGDHDAALRNLERALAKGSFRQAGY